VPSMLIMPFSKAGWRAIRAAGEAHYRTAENRRDRSGSTRGLGSAAVGQLGSRRR
jgi:hypothetical protein